MGTAVCSALLKKQDNSVGLGLDTKLKNIMAAMYKQVGSWDSSSFPPMLGSLEKINATTNTTKAGMQQIKQTEVQLPVP